MIIVFLFLILIFFLIYSLFYNKEIPCNAKMEFKKITNCSEECDANCEVEGFPVELQHKDIGEKIVVYESNNEVIKETRCLCECLGCKD